LIRWRTLWTVEPRCKRHQSQTSCVVTRVSAAKGVAGAWAASIDAYTESRLLPAKSPTRSRADFRCKVRRSAKSRRCWRVGVVDNVATGASAPGAKSDAATRRLASEPPWRRRFNSPSIQRSPGRAYVRASVMLKDGAPAVNAQGAEAACGSVPRFSSAGNLSSSGDGGCPDCQRCQETSRHDGFLLVEYGPG
jgi:hypothetical protein